MKKTKAEKGITLIALIITIVVSLSLSAVAIGEVQNDGIINHAKNAREKYQKAQENETTTLESYLQDIEGSTSKVPLELATYILGPNKTGRDLYEIVGDETDFIDDVTTKDIDESTEITLYKAITVTDKKPFFEIEYKKGLYKVAIDIIFDENGEEQGVNTVSISEIYKVEGREGQVIENGTYAGWIILTDRNGLVEIVSPDAIGSLTLGANDTKVTVISDLDGDGETNDQADISIASYNNAITTINNYCKEEMKLENVRSIGASKENGNLEENYYSSTNYNEWGKGIKTKVRKEDNQHELDFIKLEYFGKLATTNNYWVASRSVLVNSAMEVFRMRVVYDGSLDYQALWIISSSSSPVAPSGNTYSVRPVVINPSGI